MGVNGQKVWAGNEKCSPVTWQDCKLDRKEPYPTCQGDNNVDIKVSVTKCQFVTGTRCEPETRRECVEVPYTECDSERVDDCDPSKVRKPGQDFIHKKKCLLASDMEKLAAAHKH